MLSEFGILLGIGSGGGLAILLRRRFQRALSETIFLPAVFLVTLAFRAMAVQLDGLNAFLEFGSMGGYLAGDTALFQFYNTSRSRTMDAETCLLKLICGGIVLAVVMRLLSRSLTCMWTVSCGTGEAKWSGR